MNEIIKIEIQQKVKVRKYKVDIISLQTLLRASKKKTKLSNKQISESLAYPLTLVEHWFRTDNCFSIPDESIWFKLKELLQIKTDKFDLPIIDFEYKDGVYEKSNRYYFEDGIAPTITTNIANEKIIVREY